MKKTVDEHRTSFQALFDRFFPHDKGNDTWEEWLVLEKRDHTDLFDLVRSPIGSAFKARAITILLAPHLQSIPFSWPDRAESRGYVNYLYRGTQTFPPCRIEVAHLSPTLRLYMGELICLNVDFVREYHDDECIYDSYFGYNRYIVQFLGILTEAGELAHELFKRFEVSNPLPNSRVSDIYSYEAFQALLHDPKVPEGWKRKADDQMRSKIKTSNTKNLWDGERREEHPLYGYHHAIINGFKDETLVYSVPLLASQIEFLLTLALPREGSIFHGSELQHIFDALHEHRYKDLRHRLARYVVLMVDWSKYPLVHNFETKSVAEYMLLAFSFDKELVTRLKALLTKGKARIDREDREEKAKEAKRNVILARMR